MASFGATASASAAVANNVPKSSTYLPFIHRHFHHSHSKVAFRVNTRPKIRLLAKSNLNHSVVARAQLNEVSFFQLFSLEDLLSNFRSFVETLLEPYVASKVAFDGPSNAAVDGPSKTAVDEPSNAAIDGHSDAAVDEPSDAAVDEPSDAAIDGHSDAAVDGHSDAAVDGHSDAAVDGHSDAAVDGPIDGPSDAAATASSDSEAETKDVKSSNEIISAPVASEGTISAFMSQVLDLIELVDSRDIMELQLKQLDCELLIRKKDALPPPPSAAPVMYAPSHYLQQPMAPSPPPAPASRPPALPAAKPASASVANLGKSSHPPLKSPVAGTFYQSPGPGEPPFVKVGDKVQKGQVLCIVEAMKLMNEIEADRAGTIVEVLVEDGKPVSFGAPLFVIAPQ